MTRINLLPWREQRRKEQQRQFISVAAGAVILMGMIILYVHLHIGAQISDQDERNGFLKQQIAEVDKKIKEIDSLEAEKKSLLARMEIIQELQTRRPGIVRLFDEMARRVPSGIYLTEFTQKGDSFLVKGVAQSNARVSALMRNLDESEWFAEPRLEVVEVDKKKRSHYSQFTLHVKQATHKRNGEEESGDES